MVPWFSYISKEGTMQQNKFITKYEFVAKESSLWFYKMLSLT